MKQLEHDSCKILLGPESPAPPIGATPSPSQGLQQLPDLYCIPTSPPQKTTQCRINLRSIIQSVWIFMCWIRDETKELTHPSLVPIPRPTSSHSPSLAYSLLGPIPGPALILARWPCSEPGSPIYLCLVSQQTTNTNGNVNIVLILLWQRKEKSSKSIHHPASIN